MEYYEEVYIEFERILKKSKLLSIEYAGIQAPSSSHYYSSLIFTKLCVSGETILRNCPALTEVGNRAYWDFASVAALTRGFIESYLTFYYLCVEECSDKEWETRWRLMNLHDHMSRYKMFLASKDSEEAVKFQKATEEVKADLKKTSYFQALDQRIQKHFLKGNTAFLLSKDEIVERFGGNVDDFIFAYRFLSNHTHTYPMGFYRMDENNMGCGVETETEVGYTSICLSWAAQYMKLAVQDFSYKWAKV
jgi:hypothetical protein